MENTFSICIPNYNYEKYIDITLASVINQEYRKYEVVVSDNASTDKSIEVIQQYALRHPSIRYKSNPTNIGFAGNLDEAGRMATNEWMIMLSSDDVIKQEALSEYNRFIQQINATQTFAFCSTFEKIDSEGNFIEFLSAKTATIWKNEDIDEQLSNQMGYSVYKVSGGEMLKRCLTRFLNPFNFASTCYKRSIYQKVGGYGGGRLYNPDKWFHWKIIAELDYVYYLDKPLFQYRWHQQNQASLSIKTGVLKFWIDEYRNCFEIEPTMLQKSGLNQSFIQLVFINRTIIPYVYSHLIKNNRELATRILKYGEACYPYSINKNKYYWLLKLALSNIVFSQLFILVNRIFAKKDSL
jgi:glycosyltransferase involved in cell wall biosynthesis